MKYDVIIAGGSFAGLSVARELKGKVLLIDRKSVGALSTSACAAPYATLNKIGCADSVIQLVSNVNFNTLYGQTKFQLKEPFCTFDYTEFCHQLFSHFRGEFVKANIIDLKEKTVITDRGEFSASVLVDCTGWRAKLASAWDEKFAGPKRLGFGLETEIELEVEDELYLVFDERVAKSKGYAWVFPAGKKARIGLGNYSGKTDIVEPLRQFAASRGGKIEGLHGGYMPLSLREGTAGSIFLVGDSAGQIIPVTGEGIRQSIYFGMACGKIIQEILNRNMSLEAGLNAYSRFVESHRLIYRIFSNIQWLWIVSHPIVVETAARVFGKNPLRAWAQNKFFEYFDTNEVQSAVKLP